MNTITETINGREYLLYRASAQLLLAAAGKRALALVDAGGKQTLTVKQGEEAEELNDSVEWIRDVLKVAMIRPRLVEEYTGEADAVTFLELGDAVWSLYQLVLGEEDAEAANFPESSAAGTESS